jgi:hypothetical protein
MPHVIRRQLIPKPATPTTAKPTPPSIGGVLATSSTSTTGSGTSVGSDIDSTGSTRVYADDAQLGDEYISLIFHESESGEDSDSEEEDEEDGDSGEDGHIEVSDPE